MTINSIKYIPLAEMTDWDWQNLDWDLLRNKAKNRIASTIVAGTLKGFYRVDVLMKGRAKPTYHWPAEDGDNEELDTETANIFRFEADDEFESDEVENVDQMANELKLFNFPGLRLFMTLFLADLARGKDSVLIGDKNKLEELTDKALHENKWDWWDYLYVVIMIYRHRGTDWFDRTMERVDRELARD